MMSRGENGLLRKGFSDKLLTMLGLILALSLMMLSTPWVSAQAQIQDVPRGHWAYEAVSALVDAGYVSLYDDQTFRGEEPVDRFTFAAAIYQVLRQVETGGAQVSEEDVALLRQLSNEFRAELVSFYNLRDQLLQSVEESEKRIAVFDESLSRVIDVVSALEADQATLREELARESEALRRLVAGETERLSLALETRAQGLQEHTDREIARLDGEVARLDGEIARVDGEVRRIDDELARLDQGLQQADGRIHQLERGLQIHQAERLASETALRQEVQAMIDELRAADRALEQSLSDRLDTMGEFLGSLEVDLGEAWNEALSLTQRVQGLEERTSAVEQRAEALEAQTLRLEADLGNLRADFHRLRSDLSALQSGVEQDRQSLQELRTQLETQRVDLLNRLARLQQSLAETEAALYMLDSRVQGEREETLAALDYLMQETEYLLESSNTLFNDLEMLYQQLAEVEAQLERQGSALLGGQAQLLQDLRALRQRVDAMEDGLARVDTELSGVSERLQNVERQTELLASALELNMAELDSNVGALRQEVSVLGEKIGLSEEERRALTDQLRQEMAAQLNASLLREQKLQQELEELRAEFDQFRAQKDQEIQQVRGTSTIAIAAALIGLIVGFSN